jgi:hypothetical protein
MSNYVSLNTLVGEWANLSGELPAVILRRLADWSAIDDGFPPGSFVNGTGEMIDGAAIRRAALAVIAAWSVPGPHFGAARATALLESLRISKTGVIEFCRIKGIACPPSLAGPGVRAWGAVKEGWRLSAPPECSTSPPPDETRRPLDIGERIAGNRTVESELRAHAERWDHFVASDEGPKAAPDRTRADGQPAASSSREKAGRPSREVEITAAITAMIDEGSVDFKKPRTETYPEIRRRCGDGKGLGDEVIRRVIAPIFDARKEAHPEK